MSKLLFIFLLFIFYLFQILISILSIVISHFVPKVKKRLAFERLNLTMESSRSFKEQQLLADVCFEVSSEGELEQVFPLVQAFLEKQKKVEIIYSSESVEKKCQLLYEKHPAQIRLLRMPFLSGHFFSFLYFQNIGTWMSSSKIVFCRYDFFPTLLVLKFFGNKLYLVSGCVKNVSWFKRHVFSLFHYVVAANESERQLFIKDIGLDEQVVVACDFRIPRIYKRIEAKDIVFKTRGHLEPLLDYFKQKASSEKVIIGSMWPSDSLIFSQNEIKKELIENKLSVLILPHKLDNDSIKNLIHSLSQSLNDTRIPIRIMGGQHHNISDSQNSFDGITILCESGVLVEFYAFFDTAYVGGGFERSIHSVLEPFMAGSTVICGVKTHRSTEYDYISTHSPHEIHVLKNPESFYNSLIKSRALRLSRDQSQYSRAPFYKDSLKNMELFLHILEG